ncbi:hypothetical protein GCM10007973_14340 [Polymorphobacter multimanifer]|uniref:DUF4214 domain-containing protein n=1 Tax=Polymorphobacter multimanifer TaxID=1070431 RepID=A0A841LA16_9SPHN|nr:DUF4214 domain-containing protein [Polymorphobacter multimanifer]MBB6227803.1 hypothetical protein [Polymorphobacter multimanifer]GGI78791.1 hypothetical protein GCM10007973_14340 [Polymorphobacter multimanifer]
MDHDARPSTLAGLMALHDRAFIAAAYHAVLGRAPDPNGEGHYLALLRSGRGKLGLLRDLKGSSEGRSRAQSIAGLDAALSRYRLAALPLVGPLIRALTGWPGNSAIEQQLAALANEIGLLRAGGAPTPMPLPAALARAEAVPPHALASPQQTAAAPDAPDLPPHARQLYRRLTLPRT